MSREFSQPSLAELSPIEKELLFVRWCEKREIKQILFDLDDTICVTGEIFRDQMDQSYDYLATQSPISRTDWQTTKRHQQSAF
jgi:hypothetical protein